jgi:hypothetical protein
MVASVAATPQDEPTQNQIDAAIAAAFPEPEVEVPTTKFTLRLASGKPAMVEVPNDATDGDWLNVIGIIMTQVRPAMLQMQAASRPASRIIVPLGTHKK